MGKVGDGVARQKKTEQEQGQSLIDPVYQKFSRSVIRALASNDFYQFFMESIARADNEIQFSNRKEIKTIDPIWVERIEDALDGFQHVVSLPRQEIREEELIVNIANAKRTGQDVVRHLASHAAMVEDYNFDTGDVRPSRVMQKYREESIGLYENRLVFTALEMAHHFVKIRHDALFEAMSDEFGAKLKLRSDMDSATEHMHMDMFLHIKNTESLMETDAKNREIFDRISRLYRMLGVFMNTDFARQMAKFDRVKGPIHKTNILKRNPHYRSAVQLLEFLRSYDQVGYVITVEEQNPVIDEQFQQDIFHNVLFNYVVLKGHLEDERDRQVPLARKPKQRALKPKFIKEIIEEMVEDYDLPDVEIRKVLIEELTKEQLMAEEEAERLRLVEEQERLKREEQERLEAARKAEQERIAAEKAAEEERKRREEEEARNRAEAERILREVEDRRRCGIFRKEMEFFGENLIKQLEARANQREQQRQQEELDDYAEAVKLLEQEEQLRKEEAERLRARRKDERERKLQEAERAAAEKRALEEAAERQRLQAIAQQEAQQRQKDLHALRYYVAALKEFEEGLPSRQQLRRKQQAAAEARERERLQAIERRRSAKQQTPSG